MAGLWDCFGIFAKQVNERKSGEIHSIPLAGQTLKGQKTKRVSAIWLE